LLAKEAPAPCGGFVYAMQNQACPFDKLNGIEQTTFRWTVEAFLLGTGVRLRFGCFVKCYYVENA
jgi:hypothetical protein